MWHTALLFSVAGLMPANWAWDAWGYRYERTRPGTLARARAAEMRRRYRWPGFAHSPVFLCFIMVWWAPHLIGLWGWLVLLSWTMAVFDIRKDWRKLRSELDEDEDDWFNRGRRGLKRAMRRIPRPHLGAGPAPAGA